MSDPITPAAVYPDRFTPEALAANAKPKRARKAKVEKPPRAKPSAPVRTLRRRIDDLGDYCVKAFVFLSESRDADYPKSVREAIDNLDAVGEAQGRLGAAKDALRLAEAAFASATEDHKATYPVLARLYETAGKLAEINAVDVEPDAPTPDDFKGVGSV